MNRIKLLPEHVANQIAAGEVVERPASVVKELVENALDAQASRISVEIQAGGRSLVRVTDDGVGMSRDDALLCLERHATSKIQRAEDLAAIATMGFRGEALPSIASVSRFMLTTRERESKSPEGTRIIVNGGKITEVKAAGSVTGTSVEIRQLFFNLPARRKFLRAEETEAAHVQHYLTLAALAHPHVALTYVKDTRTVWQLPAVRSELAGNDPLAALRERFRALMGDMNLLAVDHTAQLPAARELDQTESFENAPPADSASDFVRSEASFRIWGLIGAPGVSRATREDQHIFVNRRPVENRGINFALLEGYHTALMKGRYPVCCLFLEINPAAVDVNIHPAKREVKFHREREVRHAVVEAVKTVLLAFHVPASASANVEHQTSNIKRRMPETLPCAQGVPVPKAAPTEDLPIFQKPRSAIPRSPEASTSSKQPALKMGFGPAPGQSSQVDVPSSTLHPPLSPPQAAPAPTPLLSVPLRLVGVIGRLYVVLESDRGLVLLDQHAAHERILFEQMTDRLERNVQAPSQKILLPETIELSPRDAQFLREQLSALTHLGVGISEFGDRTFLLDALPPFVKVADARQFVIDLVDQLKAAAQDLNSSRLGEDTVAKTVCRHAVKANDPLAGRELQNLVEDLRRCAMPYTCPHGRPTLIEMNYRELEKKFGRTQ